MEFSLQSLKIFINLVEIRSFTRTAIELNMTQPGVSQHVKALEEYFGGKLLRRVGKKFELTVKGEKIYLYAKDLFAQHESFRDSVNDDSPYTGHCRIASPGSFGIILYSFLLNLNKQYKNLSLKFYYAPNKTIERELLADELDFGCMSTKPQSELLTYKVLTQEKLLTIVPKNFRGNSFSDLLDLGYINHPDGKDMLIKVFSKNFKKEFKGFNKLKISGDNNQIGRILDPVALGLGFTILPNFAYQAYPNKKALRLVSLEKEVKNSIFLVQKKYRELSVRFKFLISKIEGEFSQTGV